MCDYWKKLKKKIQQKYKKHSERSTAPIDARTEETVQQESVERESKKKKIL